MKPDSQTDSYAAVSFFVDNWRWAGVPFYIRTGKRAWQSASRAAFTDFMKRLDYSEYGGVPLLGVRGVCIICHGRSNANAIKYAVRIAAEFASGEVNERIETQLRKAAVGIHA